VHQDARQLQTDAGELSQSPDPDEHEAMRNGHAMRRAQRAQRAQRGRCMVPFNRVSARALPAACPKFTGPLRTVPMVPDLMPAPSILRER